jgi:TPR repeat protein
MKHDHLCLESMPIDEKTQSRCKSTGEENTDATLWGLVGVPLLALVFIFCVTTCNNTLRYKETLSLLQHEAEQGDADAQFKLGNMYQNGQGVLKDFSKAFKWYQKAAEQGNADAQYRLGSLHLAGEVVIRDEQKGCDLILASGEQGNKEAIEAYNKLCAK